MELRLLLLIYTLFVSVSAVADDEVSQYSLEVAYSGSFKYMIDVKYTNLSNEAHCIRDHDIRFRNVGDFLAVTDGNNKPLTFIGTQDNSKMLMWPSAYAIVLPGTVERSSFYLNDSYKVKGKSGSLSLVLPVIPCSTVMKEYIQIPPLSRIKGLDKTHVVTDKNLFSAGYKEWAEFGFLAISNKLYFSKK